MKVYARAIKATKKRQIVNPVSAVEKLSEKESERVRFLDMEEETKVRLKLSPQHQSELTLALHTGLRRNELFRLRWTDVNLRVGLLTVAKSKNGRPRHLPLNSAAAEAIQQLAKLEDDTGYVIPGPPAPRGVTGANGSRMRLRRQRFQTFGFTICGIHSQAAWSWQALIYAR